MTQKSLGLIETIGLTAAIEAADAAVKSANVELVGYELAKGAGMTVVKLYGDVGAVKAAVAAGAAAAGKVNQVVSTQVIARPANGVSSLVANSETVGVCPPKKTENSSEKEDLENKVAVGKPPSVKSRTALQLKSPSSKSLSPQSLSPKPSSSKPGVIRKGARSSPPKKI